MFHLSSIILGILLIATTALLAPIEQSIYVPAIHNEIPCGNNLVTTLEANSGFDILLEALEAANLTAALESTHSFTLFAPTDDAFANLPTGALEQLLANPTGQLTKILLYHIVPGRIETTELSDGMQITTQQGQSITIEASRCETIVNGATIVTPNIITNNGIIHAIDIVLLPPPE